MTTSCPFHYKRATPEEFVVPYPGYEAEYAPGVDVTITAYLGAQTNDASKLDTFKTFISKAVKETNGPKLADVATFVDAKGFHNLFIIGYWDKPEVHAAWDEAVFQPWFSSAERLKEGLGYFKEVFALPKKNLETLGSSAIAPQGIMQICPVYNKETKLHGLFGSMRDRVPLAYEDPLDSEITGNIEPLNQETESKRLSVKVPKNMCTIHSGQDFSIAEPTELEAYHSKLEPVLKIGMDYLRDNGEKTGCLSMRFVSELSMSNKFEPSSKTFGLGYFVSMAHLEHWAKEHPTHLNIFNTFGKMAAARELGKLILYHQVSVAPDNLVFQYVNCHNQTGLLQYVKGTEW